MSLSDEQNQFLEDVRFLSIAARFGLAMCFLNEFCHRFRISGDALDEFRQHLWRCPLFQQNGETFPDWISDLPPLAKTGLSERHHLELCGVSNLSPSEFGRLRQIVNLTNDVLQISFFGAGEDKKTYDCLVRISELARPTTGPATTPFKFSLVSQRDGWGVELAKSDVQFWRTYSEHWFLNP